MVHLRNVIRRAQQDQHTTNPKFTSIMPGVYAVETDLGIDVWQQALLELKQCENIVPDQTDAENDSGARGINVYGGACDEISRYFQSYAWLEQVCQLCIKDAEWCYNWVASPSVQWFNRHTHWHHRWTMVPPEYFNHKPHVDGLRQVVHGMMYLPEPCLTKSLPATTIFYDGDEDIFTETGFDHGWIILQNGRQRHRGFNMSNQPRYSFKWGFELAL